MTPLQSVIAVLGLAGLPVVSAAAQHPVLDSARVAREAWTRAGALDRRQEWQGARALVRRAFEAWPTEPAYVAGYATLSARLQDTAETARALTAIADMGLTLDVEHGPAFAQLREAPALRAAIRRLAENAAPAANSTVAATLTEPDFWPEGISHDSVSGVWYLASVRHRKVARIGPDGRAEDFLREGQDGIWSVLGVRADPASRTLWLTTAALPQMVGYQPADSGRSGIYAFDLVSGGLKARYLLPPGGSGHMLGDLVVAPNGDVYATDSQDPVIWRVLKGSRRVQEFLRHPLFSSLQGPAVDPSGRTLYVADYSHGVLAVDLNTREVAALPAAPGSTALGIDGLVWFQGGLIGVQNGVAPARILRLSLDAGGRRITGISLLDRNLELAAEPTIGTVWGNRYFYVGNSQWEEYEEDGRLKAGVRLEPPRILMVRLP